MLRDLDPMTDRARVDAFFQAAADYIHLERDEAPSPDVTQEFFTDCPPGADPARSRRLGMLDATDRLLGIAELSFGYPAEGDAYLGLMMLTQAARGSGRGADLLRRIETIARDGGAGMLYLAVLDANPRGLAFWQREGFAVVQTRRPVTLGRKTQTASRLSKPL
jgi:GNAT superfamily N-acetyltransferase